MLTVSRRASASAPRPTSSGPRAAAAKASSPWSSTTATAASSPPSRSRENDQIMLVTDGGQLIRCPVTTFASPGATRRACASSRPKPRRVVSVERIPEEAAAEVEASLTGTATPADLPPEGDAPPDGDAASEDSGEGA